MKKCMCTLVVCVSATGLGLFASQPTTVLKVSGRYGIINQGVNQGITAGQEFYVKRESQDGFVAVGTVRVFRVTANRAAVEQVGRNSQPILRKNDRLFVSSAEASASGTAVTGGAARSAANTGLRPVFSPEAPERPAKPRYGTNRAAVPATSGFSSGYRFVQPWISLNLGAVFPRAKLSEGYAPGFRAGVSYMVSAGKYVDLGIEINKAFMRGSVVGGANLIGSSSVASSSILEAFLVSQKFFGRHFFVETGGGVFRPKVRTISVDSAESSFSATRFGLFGGTGILIPTSEQVGFTLRGRWHNYFDDGSRRYFGVTGGFRFKVK